MNIQDKEQLYTWVKASERLPAIADINRECGLVYRSVQGNLSIRHWRTNFSVASLKPSLTFYEWLCKVPAAKEPTKPEGDLVQELKTVLADTWRKYGDEKIVAFRSLGSFSGVEVAKEIEAESKAGKIFITDMLNLAIDLTKRDKVNKDSLCDQLKQEEAIAFVQFYILNNQKHPSRSLEDSYSIFKQNP